MLALWSDHCPNLGEVFVKVMLAVIVLLMSTFAEREGGAGWGRHEWEGGVGQGRGRPQVHASGRASSSLHPAPVAAHLVSLNGNDAVRLPVGVKVVGDDDRLLRGGNPLLAGLGVNLEDMSLCGEHWTLPAGGRDSLDDTHHCRATPTTAPPVHVQAERCTLSRHS